MTWLERLCVNRTNYWLGFVIDVIVAAALLVYGGAHIAALAVGVVAYTFYEYAFHRWLYHAVANPVRSLHANHHRDRALRLGAPFFFSLGVTALTWTVASLVVGRDAAAVFAGTILGGYAFQSAVHHIAHGWSGTYRWRGRLVRHWRRHHLRHHKHGDVNFGIVTTVWDRLFGTLGQVLVDTDRGRRAFARRDDRLQHVARRVPGHE